MSAIPPESHIGVLTSWIPLTTTYTAQDSCSTAYKLNGGHIFAFDPGYGLDVDPSVTCAPSAVTTWWEQGRLGHGDPKDRTVMSIGPMVCPDKWHTVVTSVRQNVSTLAMCCPSDYTLAFRTPGVVAGECQSSVTPGQVITYMSTPDSNPVGWMLATTTVAGSSFAGAIAIVGWDFSIAATAVTSTKASQKVVSETAEVAAKASSGMSTASAAGVAVGAAAAIIGLAALLGTWFLYRRKAGRKTIRPSRPMDPHLNGQRLYPGYGYPGAAPVFEFPPSPYKAELYASGRRPPVELGS